MFPEHGDAPGIDPPDLRPDRAERLLSAWQEARAPLIAGYRVPVSPAALERHYRAQLAARGYAAHPLNDPSGDTRTLLLSRGELRALAVLAPLGGNATLITLSPLF